MAKRITLSDQLLQEQGKAIALTEKVSALQRDWDSLHVANTLLKEELKTYWNITSTNRGLVEELEKTKKELESSKNVYSYRDKAADKAENELEQAHAVLDSVPGAPSRDYESGGSYSTTRQRNVVTRLAGAFLAIATMKGEGK